MLWAWPFSVDITTSDAVPKIACGWGTGNNHITSHGLI